MLITLKLHFFIVIVKQSLCVLVSFQALLNIWKYL